MNATLRVPFSAFVFVGLFATPGMAEKAVGATQSAGHAQQVADCRRHELPCDASKLTEVEAAASSSSATTRTSPTARTA